ncbi:MAG: thermonuclease family protein, partial [Methylotetracoccus sp.]
CSETLRGRVVAVVDGDTLTVLDIGHRQHRIRLHQIDAPEHAQDFGTRSKQSLAQLVAGREVTVEQVDTDRYGRIVGTVWAAGQDINLAQVRAGMAWVYRQYGKDPAYLAAEASAKRSRIGLWSQARPIPPWTFRHQQSDDDHRTPPRRRGGWF